MKVLVTGGGGLVGSHVIERLRSRGHEVRALVRDNVGRAAAQALGAEPVFGLVEQPGSWEAAKGVNAIVHAAALIRQQWNWPAFAAVNVEGTRLAAAAAKQNGARLVHLSSVAVYRRPGTNGAGAQTIDEDAPLCTPQTTDLYGRSKAMAEEALWAVAQENGAPTVALRPCLVYGERDRLFLPRVLDALRFGVAPLVGPGENALAMVYVGNVADAVVAALEHPSAQGPFNIANDGRLTQREFYEILASVAGRRIRYLRLSPGAARTAGATWEMMKRLVGQRSFPGTATSVRFLAGENPYTSARATDQLGWRPTTTPAAGLERAARWLLRDGEPRP